MLWPCSEKGASSAGKKLRDMCPYCRSPVPAFYNHERIRVLQEHCKEGKAWAFYTIAMHYINGECGLARDEIKGFECMKESYERGYGPSAQFNLAVFYYMGRGVMKDDEKVRIDFGVDSVLNIVLIMSTSCMDHPCIL